MTPQVMPPFLMNAARRRYGLRRRKNCGLFIAGTVTDLLAPSSATLAVFGTQLAGAASVPACSNAKPAVSAEGQETMTSAPDASSESSSAVATRGHHRPIPTKPIFKGVEKCGSFILDVFIGSNSATKNFADVADLADDRRRSEPG